MVRTAFFRQQVSEVWIYRNRPVIVLIHGEWAEL
jgi:hypothetical protein